MSKRTERDGVCRTFNEWSERGSWVELNNDSVDCVSECCCSEVISVGVMVCCCDELRDWGGLYVKSFHALGRADGPAAGLFDYVYTYVHAHGTRHTVKPSTT